MKIDDNPLMVSVRCTAYNHEPYIRQCLDGIVMQKTNFRFEAIVHDDASTDGTANIIREYAERYPDIIKPIYEIENQWSKNRATFRKIVDSACKGKYIACCEGDDYWIDSLKLQKQVDFMEKNCNCTLICNRTKRYSENQNKYISDSACYEQSQYINPADIIEKGGLFISTCSVLYRHSVKDNYPDYCFNCHVGDFPLVIMCAMKGNVYYLNEAMSVYRVENSSSWAGKYINSLMSSNKLSGIVSEIKMLNGFAKDYPKYKSVLMKRIYIYIMSNLPSRKRDINGNRAYRKALISEISEFSFNRRLIFLIRTSPFFWFYSAYYHIFRLIRR